MSRRGLAMCAVLIMAWGGGDLAWGEEAGPPPAQNDIDEELDRLEERLKRLEERVAPPDGGFWGRFGERFHLQGDLRLRTEFNRQPGFVPETDRYRQRVRLRLSITSQLTDSLMMGLRFGSGDPNNVSSGNIDLADDFSRKAFFNLDQAFLRYTTGVSTTTAGKFAHPWWRPVLGHFTAESVWDNDVQPEGITQTFKWKNVGPFEHVTVTGATLVLGQFDARRIPQPGNLMFGWQTLAKTAVGREASLTLSAGYFTFENPDSFARGRLKSGRDGPGDNFTNKLTRDAQGSVIGFASDFDIVDTSAQVELTLPGGLPIGILAEYTKNLGAKSALIDGTPIGNENDAALVYATLGKLKKPGDWLIGYGYTFIEADAVLSQFNSSNFEFTNTKTHIVFLEYALKNNVILIWDSYLQQRENETLSLLQANSAAADLLRVKTRINLLVTF